MSGQSELVYYKRLVAACLAVLIAFGIPAAIAQTQQLPLFIGETVSGHSGVLRVDNRSDVSGEVSIYAIADDGARSGPAILTLAASAAIEIEASDLESGNNQKGVIGSLGALEGDVRLELRTDLTIKAFVYLRSADGTFSVLHDAVSERTIEEDGDYEYEYQVPVFNAAQNMAQASSIRLINAGDETATVMLEGRDDSGATALGGTLGLSLIAGAARTLSAQELEAGSSGLTGQFGAGAGKWRLVVTSDQPITVVNLVTSSTGRLDNLSSAGMDGLAPSNHDGFGERFIARETDLTAGSQAWTLQVDPDDEFTLEPDSALQSRSGSYTYRRVGANAGQLTLAYTDGEPCTLNLYFTSRAAGWYAWRCDSEQFPQGEWRGGSWAVVDSMAPSPEPQPQPGPKPSAPHFPDSASPGETKYMLGTTISPLTLPAASGGNGTLTYSLDGNVPGLVFDPATRQLVGTPSEEGVYAMNFTVTDADGDSDNLRFLIVVRQAQSTDCLLALLVRAGESCTYPGTSDAFTVNQDGSAEFLIINSTRAINLPNRSYEGEVYDFRASHQGDGVWRIDRLQGVEAAPSDTTPRMPDTGLPTNRTFEIDSEIESLSLPAATGGDGMLTYDLAPEIPGLHFDPDARQLSGAPTQDGTYLMRYSVTDEDGDSDSYSFTILVIGIPDLVVDSPSASETSLSPHQSFTFAATVRNQGTAGSSATTLRYFSSTDVTITAQDTEVGTDSVGSLSPESTSGESIDVTAPTSTGTYYYGACVDSVKDEWVTDNNCSTGVRVTVAESPDLVVETPSVSNTNLSVGQSFTFSAIVRNQGRAQAESTLLRYFRAPGATITDNDILVGEDTVSALAVSGTSFESIRLQAPSSQGVYYYGACVEAVASERDTRNNCSTGVRILTEQWTSDPIIPSVPTDPPAIEPINSEFDIEIVYDNPQTPSNVRAAFDAAVSTWESAITGDLSDIDFSDTPRKNRCTGGVQFTGLVDDVRIYVYYGDIDGIGGTLGRGGICIVRSANRLPILSVITIDADDVPSLSALELESMMLHEIAHTLGFGVITGGTDIKNPSLDENGDPITPPPDTHWPAPNAVAAFNAAGGDDYAGGKVPLENQRGGRGSQDSHWRWVPLRDELMSYALNRLPILSAITIQAMADLGYNVDASVADPFTLPDTTALIQIQQDQPAQCVVDTTEVEYL